MRDIKTWNRKHNFHILSNAVLSTGLNLLNGIIGRINLCLLYSNLVVVLFQLRTLNVNIFAIKEYHLNNSAVE